MKVIFLLLITVILSCKPETKIVSESKEQVVLKGTNVPFLKGIFPQSINIIDDNLVIVNKYDLPFISIYNLTQKNKITSFGSSRDLKNPLFFPVFSAKDYVDNRWNFTITDFQTNRILTYDLNDVIKNKINAKPTHRISLPPKLIMKYSNLLKISREDYFGNYNGNRKNGKFFIYNNLKKTIEWVSYYPALNEMVPMVDLSSYYYSYTSYNSNLKLVGSAMKFFKRVDFYNIDGSLKNSSTFKPFDISSREYSPNMLQNPNSLIYYNETFAGNFFYAVCVDATQRQYILNDGKMKLHIFDWEGNLKMAIKLDRLFLGGFTVDELTNKLYVISFLKKDVENPIIEYQLPKIN